MGHSWRSVAGSRAGPDASAIIGVLICTAGLVGALTLQHSIDHVLATPALYGADFDAGNFLDSRNDKRALGEQMTPDPDIAAVGLVWVQPSTASPVHVVGPRAAADVGPNAFENMKGTLSIKQTRAGRPVAPTKWPSAEPCSTNSAHRSATESRQRAARRRCN